ncbi:tight adherence pilus pseudopilin TadF [Vibrio europaeus]|uniref:tight adherence pilus pseudopilin TadF n=1 Tax=Vibrio europaeus TaxID=300876 RepID=UPI00233FECC7|nr:tight adherence pilus pseudopilin TadF [Vibrio europaeus]MDC5840720.1 tight adherence pilus pseudopilin TadF [Vibrio europaeus]
MYKHRGSIAIEMVLVLMGLSVCLGFAADLSRKTSLQGELDNLSYAAVNLLSERELLFDHKIDVVQDRPVSYSDAKIIHDIVRAELENQIPNFDDSRYALSVEGITLVNRSKRSQQDKPVLRRQAYFHFGNQEILGKRKPVTEMVKLAPFTSKKRFAPMYRVTIYHRSYGIFNSVVGKGKQGAVMVSSSFSVGR